MPGIGGGGGPPIPGIGGGRGGPDMPKNETYKVSRVNFLLK
jgi:hypothetical protein